MPTSLRYGWVDIGTSTHHITWAQGAGASALAASIAGAIGAAGCGAPCVIGAMGFNALSSLAASAAGGDVTVRIRVNQPFLGTPYTEYTWTFRANTGETYGPFMYFDYSAYNDIPDVNNTYSTRH